MMVEMVLKNCILMCLFDFFFLTDLLLKGENIVIPQLKFQYGFFSIEVCTTNLCFHL
jgi:hypothetical protein